MSKDRFIVDYPVKVVGKKDDDDQPKTSAAMRIEQRRALALRIAKTIGRDRESIVAALRARVAFHGTKHNEADHGNWADDYDPENGPRPKPVGKIGPFDPSYNPENGPKRQAPTHVSRLPKTSGGGIDLMKTSNMTRDDFDKLSGLDIGNLRHAVSKAAAAPDVDKYRGETEALKRLRKMLDEWTTSVPDMDGTTIGFHGRHNQEDHGNWADGPGDGDKHPWVKKWEAKHGPIKSSRLPGESWEDMWERKHGKGKSAKAKAESDARMKPRRDRGLEESADSYDTSHPLLKDANMNARIPTNYDGDRVWKVGETDFDDLVRDGLQPGEQYVVADFYSTPTIDRFDPREHYVGGDYDHLLRD